MSLTEDEERRALIELTEFFDGRIPPSPERIRREFTRVYLLFTARKKQNAVLRRALIALHELPVVGTACNWFSDDEDEVHDWISCPECKAEAEYRQRCADVTAQVEAALRGKPE